MLLRKMFENFHPVIFRPILFKLFDPNSECFTSYDAFCSYIFDYACLRRIANEEIRNDGKIVGLYIKNIFENGWIHTPQPMFPLIYCSLCA